MSVIFMLAILFFGICGFLAVLCSLGYGVATIVEALPDWGEKDIRNRQKWLVQHFGVEGAKRWKYFKMKCELYDEICVIAWKARDFIDQREFAGNTSSPTIVNVFDLLEHHVSTGALSGSDLIKRAEEALAKKREILARDRYAFDAARRAPDGTVIGFKPDFTGRHEMYLKGLDCCESRGRISRWGTPPWGADRDKYRETHAASPWIHQWGSDGRDIKEKYQKGRHVGMEHHGEPTGLDWMAAGFWDKATAVLAGDH